MSKKTWMPLLIAAGVALSALPFTASAQSKQGYWIQPSTDLVWKNASGQCWRAGYWTPAMAIAECDPDLMPKPAATPPPPPPPVKPAAKPAAKPKPVAEKVTLAADVLFDFDKAELKPAGKEALDGFAEKLKGVTYEVVVAVGHTDRIGSEQYNKKLSVRRAEAVKAYLVGKGVPANKVYTDGKGEADPVTKPDQCKGNKATKALVQCLQPDRRVDVEVAGTRGTK